MLVGAVAVTAGLADRLGSMDQLIIELNNINKKENYKEKNMPENLKEQAEEKHVDAASIEANAVAAERKRVAELMAINIPGCEKLVQEAISSGASVAEANARIVAYIQSEEYKASFKKEEHVVVQAVEPIVAGADMSDISKEDAQVNTMLELSKQFQKGVK